MQILLAPDKFKGTATAPEAAEALAAGLRALGHEVVCCPLADGGEGTLDALGGANRSTVVTGPLGDPVTAEWRLAGRIAVIEMAQASGLALVGGAEGNDPVAASTYGTGELISTAVEAGARHVVVGVGGSATTDGGLGALRAMYPVQRYRGTTIEVACDVRLGFVDAARVCAPQKGATPAQVELLERRLERLVQVYDEEYRVDCTTPEVAAALRTLEEAGALEWGKTGEHDEFFPIKLKDENAAYALVAYASAAARKDPEFGAAVNELAQRAGQKSPYCKTPD